MEDNQELSFDRFFETYTKKIVPKIQEMEPERQELLAICKLRKNVSAVILILGITLFLLSFLGLYIYIFDTAILIFPGVALMLVSWYLFYLNKRKNKEFKNQLKNQVLKSLLDTIPDIKWTKHDKDMPAKQGKFSNCQLDLSGLFLDFNEQYIDDEFEGNYKGVNFKVSEVRLFKNLRKQSYNAFNGAVISYKCNKKIRNRTVISTKGNYTKKQNFAFSLMMMALSLLEIFKRGYAHWKLIIVVILLLLFAYVGWYLKQLEEPLNKITLEDPKFNRRFDVYSSDEVEARYLVTPLFMELLDNLKTAFGSKKLKCSFFDDNFMIAISTAKDVFEIGDLFTPCDNPEFVLQFWRELSSIYKMIEYFKLDEKTYSH